MPYHVTNGLKLYRWFDTLVVAVSKRDVQSQLTEQGLTLTNFKRFPVTLVRGNVKMQERPDGEPVTVERTPREIIETCGRGVIPEGE